MYAQQNRNVPSGSWQSTVAVDIHKFQQAICTDVFYQQLARTSFFPRHANGKVSKSWGKHISKRIQTNAKGSKRSIAGGNKHIVWDPPICLDAKPKGDLMVSLFTLIFKIFDHKMVEVFFTKHAQPFVGPLGLVSRNTYHSS